MNMKTVIESGLTFGPFEAEDLFEIEKSRAYKSIQDNMPIAEFVVLRQGNQTKVFTVEAKSSSPQPGNKVNFDKFIKEIAEKLTNTFSLTQALILGRHPYFTEEISGRFRSLDLASCGHRLVLVINGHKEEWLPQLQDALKQELIPLAKTWGFGPNAVLVLNEGLARERALIQ